MDDRAHSRALKNITDSGRQVCGSSVSSYQGVPEIVPSHLLLSTDNPVFTRID